jgi:hypothetical protein
MTIDNCSDGGSWRREMLARPLSVSQLREIISELEHALTVERSRTSAMVSELAAATAREMELRAALEHASRIFGAGSPSEAASGHSRPS